MKRYNTPHRHRVIKTRLTEEEYAEFSERVTLCKMSQSEYIRQALTKSRIRPVITVSPVNDELLSAVGKLTAEYGKIGGNLNQIARCLNEYGAPYNASLYLEKIDITVQRKRIPVRRWIFIAIMDRTMELRVPPLNFNPVGIVPVGLLLFL